MKQTLLAIAVVIVMVQLIATSSASEANPIVHTPSATVREIFPLIEGWRFKQDDTIRGAEAPEFSDAGWAVVSVPHTWNRVGYYLNDVAGRVNAPDNINKTQGVGWYRLAFTPPAAFKGKRAWIQFDAASRVANVWLNGIYLGDHKGGFSRFRLDATAALKPSQRNVLVVKVDNSNPAPGLPTADTLPLAGDFFVHGGLYRPVSLIGTDPVHVDMLDFGGPGAYATTTAIDSQRAEVRVRTQLRNDGRRRAQVMVTSRLRDADNRVTAESTQRLVLEGHAGSEVVQSLTLAQAHLWQGMEDPYLYQLQVEVSASGGRVLDTIVQPFGVRQMHMDPDRGFLLNGRPLRLHGVALHQDREGKGWAIGTEDVAADVELLREMGANTIRLSHYQHGQPIHELADRYGLILWDEIPLVSVWTLGGQKEATPALVANARQQLQELIRQNINHASVANWGIANEVDFGDSLRGFLTNDTGEAPDPLPLLRELNALAKAEDPSRPTALATCCETNLFAPNIRIPITASEADLGGANRYFGWYYGQSEDLSAHLEALHAKRPRQPLAITEYGAGGAISLHTDNPRGGPISSRGREQPEEYQSELHEQAWAVLKTKPYLWATWLWNAFDFATTIRREGDADDINTKGLITYDRKVKKDAFYFYKANWTNTPTVHVNGHRYVDRSYVVADVRVYSNALSTEVRVNGKSLGVANDCPNKVCVWHNVSLVAGANEVVATGRFGAQQTEDRAIWRVDPDVLEHVRIDSGSIMGAQTPQGHFGSDHFFEGGVAKSVNAAATFGRASEAKKIVGTEIPQVAASYREGDFRYRIPVRTGPCWVKLTFVEPDAAAGERRFDVFVDDARQISNLDVAATAGGPLRAVTRSFRVRENDGVLDLRFNGVKGQAIVSAVEVSYATEPSGSTTQ
jgi:beta-galactosidase